jgi:flagellar biosynthesis/type III secretory pathway protein FliH
MINPRADYDSPWKELLEGNFPEFLAFFFPDIYFIDWMMALPPELEEQFEAELEAYEEVQRMRYVTTIEQRAEQRGVEQGIEQGIEQALRESIITLLTERFYTVPEDLINQLARIDDPAVLRILFRRAITIDSPAAFAELLLNTLSGKREGGGQ